MSSIERFQAGGMLPTKRNKRLARVEDDAR